MSTRVDADEVESTRSERLLAVALTAFLLIGATWFYVKVGDWWPREQYTPRGFRRPDNLHNAWLAAGVRLMFIVAWLVAAYRVLLRLRQRNSRFLPLAFSGVATGVITALVFAWQYIGEWIAPFDLGPLVLSVLGIAVTVAAFVLLQRYLARRVPGRRVRKGECPFCGYPVRDRGPRCEGCGRDVVADCATCGEDRRVGSLHCVACGAQ